MDYFGPTPVYEITREDVRGFSAALERKGLAPKSRANAVGTLHSLIEFAIDEGWTSGGNPADGGDDRDAPGQAFALRWRDVDWTARRIRVRRNYVRGEFGTPSSPNELGVTSGAYASSRRRRRRA
ncbi:MAG: site-specific integrase [Solirubrobacteraceae bacterium]